MKKLKNLTDIGNLLASHPIYTYDYTDGLYINPYNRVSKFTQSIWAMTLLLLPFLATLLFILQKKPYSKT